MEFRKVGVTFVMAVAVGVLAAGCPGGAGTLGQSCTDNLSCSEGEICHPTAKVCAQTCTAPSDCDTGACNAVSGTSDMVCSCGSNADCSSLGSDFTCVSGANVCAAPGGGGDAGTGGGACDFGTCSQGQVCSYPSGGTSGTCQTAASCTGEGQTTCSYGQFCSGSTCSDVTARPTGCENFDASSTKPTWTPANTNQGFVIYSFTPVSGTNPTTDNTFCCPTGTCTNNKRWKFNVKFYAPNGASAPSTQGGLPTLNYVNTSGNVSSLASSIQNYTASGSNGSLTLNFCSTATTQFQPAIFFQNGNERCQQFSAQ